MFSGKIYTSLLKFPIWLFEDLPKVLNPLASKNLSTQGVEVLTGEKLNVVFSFDCCYFEECQASFLLQIICEIVSYVSAVSTYHLQRWRDYFHYDEDTSLVLGKKQQNIQFRLKALLPFQVFNKVWDQNVWIIFCPCHLL